MKKTIFCLTAAAAFACLSAPSFALNYTAPVTGSVTWTEDVSIDVPSSYTTAATGGIYLNSGTAQTVTMDGDHKVTIRVEDASANSNARTGIHAGQNATVTLGETDIVSYTYGVMAQSGGKVTLGDDSRIVSQNSGALSASGSGSAVTVGDGVYLYGTGSTTVYVSSGASVNVGDGAQIYNDGKGELSPTSHYGVYASGANSRAAIGDNSAIRATGSASNSAVYAASGAKITVGGRADLFAEGSSSYAVYASGANSAITVGSGSLAATSGADSYAVVAYNGGTVDLLGDQTIVVNMDRTDTAILAQGGSSATTVTADGVLDVTGGIYATGSAASIDMTFRDGSSLVGASSAAGGSTVNLDMYGTRWNVTGDSSVTELGVDGGTVLDFRSGRSAIGTTLTVDYLKHLSDGAIFILRTDIAALQADKLVIDDTEENAHYIHVREYGSAATTGQEILTLAETNNNSDLLTFALSTETGQAVETVDAGGFQYALVKDGTNWNLAGTGKSSAAASAAVNTFTGAYLLSYAETQTLMQRLGDLRESDGQQGAWFRGYGGKMESDSTQFLEGFKMDYWGVQIGTDRKIENDWNGDLYVGAMFGYAKGDLDYDTGSAAVDSKTVGLYGTYLRPDGIYADLVLKYMWMENDFDVIGTSSGPVKGGALDTGGFGASFETGKRFRFDASSKTGWYVEPQAQVSYTRQDGGAFYASNGLRVDVDGFTSLLGRLGVQIGYEMKETKNPLNLYAKISRVREFDGDVGIRLNGAGASISYDDSWWVYGIGLTSQIGGRHNLYLDLERTEGGLFKEPWALKAGWRVTF